MIFASFVFDLKEHCKYFDCQNYRFYLYPIFPTAVSFLAVKHCKNCKTYIFINLELSQKGIQSTVERRIKVKPVPRM
jgi:hypothetical protein